MLDLIAQINEIYSLKNTMYFSLLTAKYNLKKIKILFDFYLTMIDRDIPPVFYVRFGCQFFPISNIESIYDIWKNRKSHKQILVDIKIDNGDIIQTKTNIDGLFVQCETVLLILEDME